MKQAEFLSEYCCVNSRPLLLLQILLIFVFSITNSLFADQKDSLHTVIITDMAGRNVTLPKVINSVYATSPMGEVMMYTLAPSKIAGKTWTLDDAENTLLIDEYRNKPVLGGWFGKNTTGNPEVIIKAHPDIVISMGYLNKTDISSAERIEEQLGIPVIMLDAHLTMLDSTYRFIGKILGIEKRADSLAEYCRSTIDLAVSTVAKIPDIKRRHVYYAEGLNGLETDPEGSMHTEVLKMVGGINVAQIPLPGTYGRGTVSFEQILVWKPEIILVCLDHGYPQGTEHYSNILSNPSWQAIDAIKKGNIYCIPSLPFNWFDRPPSVNRLIGIRWLGNLLYPEFFKLDIKKKPENFINCFIIKNLLTRNWLVYWLMQFENNFNNIKENQTMWLKMLNEWKEKGIDCAIVTIVKSEGSTPRGVGSKMVVNALTGEIAGSVGGGLVEYECMKLVEEAIQLKKTILKEFSLKGEIDGGSGLPCGGICGGSVTVLIEPVLTGINEVVIFGGGHIGEKISKYCEILNMPYRVFDNREEFSSVQRFPSATERICKPYESLGEAINLTCASYCIILTHGHEHDEICLDQLLKNSDVPYIGMIGSQKKVNIIIDNIRSRGGMVDDRVYSPIGLKIANNLPEQIALAIMAQIIMLINKGSPEHFRFPWHEKVVK